jgi:hypothetical protein
MSFDMIAKEYRIFINTQENVAIGNLRTLPE